MSQRPTQRAAVLSATIILAAGTQAQVTERLKLDSPDPQVQASFGVAVDVDGPLAIVGADGQDFDMLEDVGAVFVFDAFSGEFLRTLSPAEPEADTLLGITVAMEGQTVVAGAIHHKQEMAEVGAAYLFDAGTGQQLDILLASDGADGDLFGATVAMDGGRVVVGAPLHSNTIFFGGAVYVFDADTGEQIHKIEPADLDEMDNFGWQVAISGDTIVASSWRDDGAARDAGAAYIIDAASGEIRHKLLPELSDEGQGYGQAIAVDGDLVLIGAPGVERGEGRVYVYDAATGELQRTLAAPTPRVPFNFGAEVAVLDDLAVIGEPNGFNTDVFYFDARTGELIAEVEAMRSAVSDSFGYSLGIGPSSMIAGASTDQAGGFDSGVAYVFDLPFTCRADLDGDGELTLFDFLEFQNLFDAGSSQADFDGDGDLTLFDFLAFQNDFDAGCP